jgi:enamine deaminase RidA (YjgF/YER057c/UK114 family)
MPRTIVNPSTIHPPAGYSHVVEATGSRLVFVAGQAALDESFGIVGEGDLAAQSRTSTRPSARRWARRWAMPRRQRRSSPE